MLIILLTEIKINKYIDLLKTKTDNRIIQTLTQINSNKKCKQKI